MRADLYRLREEARKRRTLAVRVARINKQRSIGVGSVNVKGGK